MHDNEDTLNDVSLWELPPISDDDQHTDDNRTNALKKPFSNWKYEPPEAEQEEIAPLTAEQIEEIRQSAIAEGFDAGKLEGFEQGKSEGYEVGLQQGLDAGKAQGQSEAFAQTKTELDEQLSDLNKLVEHLQSPIASVNRELKTELYLLAIELCQQIVKKQVQMDDAIVLQAISEALSKLPIHEQLIDIYVNPEQLSFIKANMPDIVTEDNTNHANEIQLIADDKMEKGGCKVITESNAIDMSIKRRCQQVFAQVLEPLGLGDDPRVD